MTAITRRVFLASLAALGSIVPFARLFGAVAAAPPLTKAIPKTGERLPVIGMGSWLTFSVGDDQPAREVRFQVLRAVDEFELRLCLRHYHWHFHRFHQPR